MNRFVAVVLLATLAVPSFAADTPHRQRLGWKGVALGEKAHEKWTDVMCDEKDVAGDFQWCYDAVDLGGGASLSVKLRLDGGRLVYMDGDIDPNDWAFVVEVFRERYGKPSTRQTQIVQNAMGATFQNETLTWLRKEGSLWASKYMTTLTSGGLSMMTPEEFKRQSGKLANPKDAAKKF